MKNNPLKIGYLCLARPASFDENWANEVHTRSLAALTAMGIPIVHTDGLTVTDRDGHAAADTFEKEGIDCLLVQYSTFALGTLIPILAERLSAPIILWSVPEPKSDTGRLRANSFCAANMNGFTLTQLERKFEYLYCNPEEIAPQLQPLLDFFSCLDGLRRLRVGIIGHRALGFYTSNADEMALRRTLGVEMFYVSLAEVQKEMELALSADTSADSAILQQAGKITVSTEDITRSAALYRAFKTVIERYDIDALAIKCWPEMMTCLNMAACSVLGMLSQEGILCGCEADVLGTVSMWIEQKLTGKMPFFADLVDFDDAANTAVFWHCGAAAPCLAKNRASICLSRHPGAGGGDKFGVSYDFPIVMEGTVTVGRIGTTPHGMRIFYGTCQAQPADAILKGNSLVVKFAADNDTLRRTIMENGLEHHYTLVPGDLSNALCMLGKWTGLDVLEIGKV